MTSQTTTPCSICRILGGDRIVDGVRIIRKYDPIRGGIVIVASKRSPHRNYTGQ